MTIDPWIEKTLTTIIAQRKDELAHAGDWPDFQYRKGRLDGIAEALWELCEVRKRAEDR